MYFELKKERSKNYLAEDAVINCCCSPEISSTEFPGPASSTQARNHDQSHQIVPVGLGGFYFHNILNNECNDHKGQGKNTWLSFHVSLHLLIYVQFPSHLKHLL